jgi:hypothetical protein
MGPTTQQFADKNPIRVRVWAFFAPTGMLMGFFLTHRVKRVWVRSIGPRTRYLMGHPFIMTCGLASKPYVYSDHKP